MQWIHIQMKRRRKITNRLCSRNLCAAIDDDIIKFSVTIQYILNFELNWLQMNVFVYAFTQHERIANACVGLSFCIGTSQWKKIELNATKWSLIIRFHNHNHNRSDWRLRSAGKKLKQKLKWKPKNVQSGSDECNYIRVVEIYIEWFRQWMSVRVHDCMRVCVPQWTQKKDELIWQEEKKER